MHPARKAWPLELLDSKEVAAVDILRRVQVPTGDILVVQGSKGKLECLSLGDYGKNHNVKADFLGLDRNLGRVEHAELVPLHEKWVITVSTQYGCSMGCPYCDVPTVGPGRNATERDLIGQVIAAMNIHPEILASDRLNVHFARMGEPTWNPAVLDCARWLKDHIDPEYVVHPVVSTMMPSGNEWLKTFIHSWMRIKNRLYHGNAGLQISINSTDPGQRDFLFNGNALSLSGIARVMDGVIPAGRKIALNFFVAGYTIDPAVLLEWFPPEFYMCKLTPMHKTARASANGIATDGDYATIDPYLETEAALKAAGYDVLVFVASDAEDLGRITCGNAILSGTEAQVAV
jgi:23S rRNA (adenine2503-C2)-methyltransferase